LFAHTFHPFNTSNGSLGVSLCSRMASHKRCQNSVRFFCVSSVGFGFGSEDGSGGYSDDILCVCLTSPHPRAHNPYSRASGDIFFLLARVCVFTQKFGVKMRSEIFSFSFLKNACWLLATRKNKVNIPRRTSSTWPKPQSSSL